MGNPMLSLVLTLMAAAAPAPRPEAPNFEAAMSEARFQQLLLSRDLAQLEQACLDPLIASSNRRKQALRDRLLVLDPVPTTFELVQSHAQALLSCGSPDGAGVVLNRYSPAAGEERSNWLLMRWQAADAGLDHRQAALALRRLVDGDLPALDRISLMGQRNALDQLAEHEAAQGRSSVAAAVLLSGQLDSTLGARRLAKAAGWLGAAEIEEADRLLETALDLAAASQAWGLAMELLQIQLDLQLAAGRDGERPRQRMERLALRLDDNYTVQQLRPDGEPGIVLRSPRGPGGHAAVGESSVAPLP